MLLETAFWSDAQREAFENECFAAWLNRVDAFSDYDWRRGYPLHSWRYLFDAGHSERDAIKIVANSGGVCSGLRP